MKLRRIIIIVMGLSCAALLGLTMWLFVLPTVDTTNCQQVLRNLYFQILSYRNDYRALPPSLEAVVNESQAYGVLICPGSDNAQRVASEQISTKKIIRVDFYYINWSSFRHPSGATVDEMLAKFSRQGTWIDEYPLAYDRRMSNHKGRGINVLMLSGRVMWDPRAEWLKKFASDNPDLSIQIPQ